MRVALRPVAPDDLPVFYEQQADPAATAMAIFPPREREAFNAHWAKILADPVAIIRTVIANNEVAGYVLSWPPGGRRQVGYWIGRRHWGKGVATEGLRLFLDVVDTRPLYAHVAVTNVGSIRVLEKCGFVWLSSGAETPAPGAVPVMEHLYMLK